MKKIIALVLATVLLVFAFAGCGATGNKIIVAEKGSAGETVVTGGTQDTCRVEHQRSRVDNAQLRFDVPSHPTTLLRAI